MRLRRASATVALTLLASAVTGYGEEAWESEAASNCWQNGWILTVLGVIGVAVILKLGGATMTPNELYYRNSWWRLSWWASCLSLLAGVILLREC